MTGRVVWVVDGDTIHVRVGPQLEKVRYIGVNAPEIPHEARGWREGGAQAHSVNRHLVAGQTARLELDLGRRDTHGHADCTKAGRIFVRGSFNRPEEVTDGGEPTSGWTQRVQSR
jgi:endonuclease YncB( thermonuclease family)